eukprot:6168981-Prymnesium_polylepis.1
MVVALRLRRGEVEDARVLVNPVHDLHADCRHQVPLLLFAGATIVLAHAFRWRRGGGLLWVRLPRVGPGLLWV